MKAGPSYSLKAWIKIISDIIHLRNAYGQSSAFETEKIWASNLMRNYSKGRT